MANAGRPTKIFASVALVMAMVAFVLGFASFTPALVLAVVAAPIATTTLCLGARRLSIVALYWAGAAIQSSPQCQWLPARHDYMLVALATVGVVLSATIYLKHIRANPAT